MAEGAGWWSLAGAAVAWSLVLAACSGAVDGLPVAEVPGLTLDKAAPHVPAEAIVFTQDASPRVGLDASYRLDQSSSPDWTVVAICADGTVLDNSSRLELAVIPSSSVDEQIRQSVRDGGFSDAIACEGIRSAEAS
ncbi:MAG: hypothetical protein LBU05_06935 [Bifidobacteriaceae bacterium]|nr:hypothetical protein [Bifidobacteriaceae bacterium]